MASAAGESWVRVESEDELRAGIWVESRPCAQCGARERAFLVARDARVLGCDDCGDYGPGWATCGSCSDGHSICFKCEIREGRLYRLVLDEPAETTEREREREDVA